MSLAAETTTMLLRRRASARGLRNIATDPDGLDTANLGIDSGKCGDFARVSFHDVDPGGI